MAKPELDLFRKAADFVRKRIQLDFTVQYKSGSSWKTSPKNQKWNKKLRYRYIAYVKRRNKRWNWPLLLIEYQTNSIIQLYKDPNYKTKVSKQIYEVKDINSNSQRQVGIVYFTAKKNANADKDAISGLYQGIPVIPSPLIGWAVKKKNPRWAK